MAYGDEVRKPKGAAHDIKKIEKKETGGVFDLLSEGGNPIDLFPSDEMSHDPNAAMGLETKSPYTEKMDMINKFISTPEFMDLDPFQRDKILKAHTDLRKLSFIGQKIAEHGKGMDFGDMSDEEAATLLGRDQYNKEMQEHYARYGGDDLPSSDYRHPESIKMRRENQEKLSGEYGDPLITDIVKIMNEAPGWFEGNSELETMQSAKGRERKQFYDYDEREWKKEPRHGELSKEDMSFIQDILNQK